MSVREYLTRQVQVFENIPECWVIIANSVHVNAEAVTSVAVFDTRAQAEAYVRASLLPADWTADRKLIQSRHRSFRPDSLLWEYNDTVWLAEDTHGRHYNDDSEISLVRRVRNLLLNIQSCAVNPDPPSGPIPMDVFAADAQQRLEST